MRYLDEKVWDQSGLWRELDALREILKEKEREIVQLKARVHSYRAPSLDISPPDFSPEAA